MTIYKMIDELGNEMERLRHNHRSLFPHLVFFDEVLHGMQKVSQSLPTTREAADMLVRAVNQANGAAVAEIST